MKTRWIIFFVLQGILLYVLGIVCGGNGIFMIISLVGGCVMMIGLIPLLERKQKKGSRNQ